MRTITFSKSIRTNPQYKRTEVEGIPIDETPTVKYVEVTLDESLTFGPNAKYLQRKGFATKTLIELYIQNTTPAREKLKKQL